MTKQLAVFLTRGCSPPYSEGTINLARLMVLSLLKHHKVEVVLLNMHYAVEDDLSPYRVEDLLRHVRFNFGIPIIKRHAMLHSATFPVKVIGSCFEFLQIGRLFLRVNKISQKKSITLHLINTFKPPALLFRKRNVTLVTHVYSSRSSSLISHVVLQRSDTLLVSSQRIMGKLARDYSGTIVHVYPPIDLDLFVPKHQTLNTAMNERDKRILYIGNLTDTRFPDEILPNLASLLRYLKLEFEILAPLNSDNLRRGCEIRRQARKLRIDDLVSVKVKDITDGEKLLRLQEAYVFIFAPREDVAVVEPPLAVMEAMACGVPVVCSRVAALNEIVFNGHNGFICDLNENTYERIQGLISSTVQDQSLRDKLSINARKTMETLCARSIEKIGVLLR